MGTTAFPYMVDPNTKTSMPESDEIVKYLFETYGEGAKVDTFFSRVSIQLNDARSIMCCLDRLAATSCFFCSMMLISEIPIATVEFVCDFLISSPLATRLSFLKTGAFPTVPWVWHHVIGRSWDAPPGPEGFQVHPGELMLCLRSKLF